MRQATSPATCGAEKLVPTCISLPVSHAGTVEYAIPGASSSGFAASPPRALHIPTMSGVADAPGRANTPGSVDPTARTRSAVAGKPTVESPGPSFPALTVSTTSG
jgi:hypothetical protein